MSVLQTNSKTLQNTLQKEDNTRLYQAIAAALVLLAAFVWPAPVITFGIGIFAAWRLYLSEMAKRENQARCGAMRFVFGTVFIPSISPMEPAESVYARAKQFEQDLKDSGNPHADKIQVVPYPFNPMIYGPDQITMSWNIYWKQFSADLHTASMQWAETCPDEIKALFLNQVIPAPTQQAAI